MARARLEITDALGTRTVAIDKPLFSIGRRSDHDLHLTGGDVSRDHAEIAKAAGGFLIRDRHSKCGTFVNGEPVAERRLESGDRIHIGRRNGAELVFHIEHDARSGSTAEPPTEPSQARGELHQIAALLEALRALGAGRVLDDVLAIVLDSALAVTGAERGFVMLAERGGHLEFKLGRGRKRVTLPGQTFQTSRKIPEEVFLTGEPRVVADLLDADLAGGHVGTIALGIRHVLCVPLAVGPERRIGVLYLDSRERGALLSFETRSALETLATEAALAIENARLYRESIERARLEQQLSMAADIQQALFPGGHYDGAGFEVSCRSVPSLTIGGDFFDYLQLPGDRFGFVLGDVSGKGVPAALLTAMLQGVFAAEATLGHEPAEAVERANRALAQKGLQSKFATLVYGTVGADGVLTVTTAGHLPPLLIRDREVQRLSTGGTIVGAFPDIRFAQEGIALQRNDLVVAFSDGVTEAFNSDWEEFGEQRLIEVVLANRDQPVDALVDAVVSAVKAFANEAAQSDDLTVLALRYTGQT